MQEKISYRSERVYCGKPGCRKCREGIGHGPYWYAYKTVNGRRKKSYIGRHLPETAVVPPSRSHIGRVNQSPLVGRDAERSLLHTSVMQLERRSAHQKQDERARVQRFILTGEAGIGKTRLAEETARLANS